MREIKFRAWDKENKKMLFANGSSSGDFWYPWGFQMRSKYQEQDSRSNNCELMQFTGLKDKNGKKIYEGDVIKVKDKTIWLVEPIGSLERDGNNYGLCVSPNGSGENYFIDDSILKGEIIGNIWENPELLKGLEE